MSDIIQAFVSAVSPENNSRGTKRKRDDGEKQNEATVNVAKDERISKEDSGDEGVEGVKRAKMENDEGMCQHYIQPPDDTHANTIQCISHRFSLGTENPHNCTRMRLVRL